MNILIVLKVSEQTVSVPSTKNVACHINTAIRQHIYDYSNDCAYE